MIVFIPQVTFFSKYFCKGTFNLRLSAVSIMATWDILSASPLQSTTSDTPTTQQRFPCPTHQDAGESHTPCISRWVGWNPWRMQTGGTVAAGPHVLSPGSGGWPCSPSKPCAVGEVVHTTPASCACRTHSHREPGTSDSRAHGPAPPVVKVLDSAPRLPHGVPTNATTLEMAQKPWPWLPSPAIPQQQCPQAHHQGCSAGAHLPCGPGSDACDSSDLRATGSDNKGAQVAPLANGGTGNGCFSAITSQLRWEEAKRVCSITTYCKTKSL